MLVDKRREVLRLYREILRTSRQFQWTNEQGEQWSTLLKKNVRMEMEQNRHEQNSESIAKMIILGWKALEEVQQKLTTKHAEIQKNYHQQQQQQHSSDDKPAE